MLRFVKQNLIRNHLLSIQLFNFNVKSKTTRKTKMENTIFRDWINNPNYQNYQQKNDETQITIMYGMSFQTSRSYNILAQDLIDKHTYLYYRHNSEDLIYDRRSKKLFNEMRRIKPDILCLQEMQESHLMDFKLKCFSIDLHEVIFKKRTQEGQTDGCAIFFNSDLMELVQEEKVEYFQPNVNILNRSNVAIIAKFRLKNRPHSELVVATTHLLYNPRRQDVRLAQLQVLFSEIDRVAFRGVNEYRQSLYLPIILTGDFNFQPSTASYAFIVNGSLEYKNLNKRLEIITQLHEPKFGNKLLPIDLGITDECQHFDRKTTMLYNSENQQKVVLPTVDTLKDSCLPFETGMIRHQLNLCSVYDINVSVSTFQNQWVLVDYIYYRKDLTPTNQFVEDKLKLIARFELPSLQHCFFNLPSGGIPNMWQGSDHFSLAAKFLLSSSSST